MKRTVVALVVAAAATALMIGGAAASAGASSPSAAEACEELAFDERFVAVTLPGGDRPHTDTVRLHSGSTATVLLCEDSAPVPPEDGQRWSVSGSELIVGSEPLGNGWRIETGAATEPIDLASVVSGERVEAGVTVARASTASVRSEFDDVDDILFENATVADRYATRETGYLDSADAVSNRSERLETTTQRVRSEGVTEEIADDARRELEQMGTEYNGTVSDREGAQRLLFGATFERGPASDDRLRALEATEQRQERVESDVDASVAGYTEAVEAEYRSAATALRNYLLPVSAFGLLLGLLGGGVHTTSKGRQFQYFRDFDSSSSYGPSVLIRPLALAFVLLLVGVGLLLWAGVLDAYVSGGILG